MMIYFNDLLFDIYRKTAFLLSIKCYLYLNFLLQYDYLQRHYYIDCAAIIIDSMRAYEFIIFYCCCNSYDFHYCCIEKMGLLFIQLNIKCYYSLFLSCCSDLHSFLYLTAMYFDHLLSYSCSYQSFSQPMCLKVSHIAVSQFKDL